MQDVKNATASAVSEDVITSVPPVIKNKEPINEEWDL